MDDNVISPYEPLAAKNWYKIFNELIMTKFSIALITSYNCNFYVISFVVLREIRLDNMHII